MSKTPRKTLAESKAEAFAAGFYACLRIITQEWRERTSPGQGPSVKVDIWPIIEKMEAYGGLYDEDYKALYFSRIGDDFERLRKRVKVLQPHPHAGRKGFILDSESLMYGDMHRVYFLDRKGKADNAFAKPGQLKELK